MRDRAFFTLFFTLLHLVFKIFRKKNFTLIKVLNRTIWEFLETHAHLFEKQVIMDRKVFKRKRYSSVTLHVNPITPMSEGSKKIPSTKIQILPKKIFLSDLVLKLLNLFVFESLAWKISSNWSFQRNVGFDLKMAQTSKHCYIVVVLILLINGSCRKNKTNGPNYNLVYLNFFCWFLYQYLKKSISLIFNFFRHPTFFWFPAFSNFLLFFDFLFFPISFFFRCPTFSITYFFLILYFFKFPSFSDFLLCFISYSLLFSYF